MAAKTRDNQRVIKENPHTHPQSQPVSLPPYLVLSTLDVRNQCVVSRGNNVLVLLPVEDVHRHEVDLEIRRRRRHVFWFQISFVFMITVFTQKHDIQTKGWAYI